MNLKKPNSTLHRESQCSGREISGIVAQLSEEAPQLLGDIPDSL
jgi:hypothetical protein